MTSEPLIAIRDLWFSYGNTPVLENVNLRLQQGESVCMVGPNGGGKTTLLKLMLGLLRPDRGEVRLFDISPRRARLRVGYMPQYLQFDPQFPASVLDVVLMGRLGRPGLAGLLGWYSPEDRHAAMAALEDVWMADFARRPFSDLSGGQRQRVLLARALACQPSLLMLDEPTNNVDASAENRLAEVLRRLSDRMSILMVSHDIGFVTELVQHVVCVNRTVVMHPTSRLSGTTIEELYNGEPVRAVLHGEHCPDVRHIHHD